MTASSTPPITERARAKVNLTLEVPGRRGDGYHELVSLVAFADIGDDLSLVPAVEWGLTVDGPMAAAISGPNLVDQAAQAVRTCWPGAASGQAHLFKVLPVAAGIGGGSADAAAMLRAIRTLNKGKPDPPDWHQLARGLGADVPVCLACRLTMMQGRGEQLVPVALATRFFAVLVNPMTPLSTARVFANLAAPKLAEGYRPPPVPDFATRSDVLGYVLQSRNDLEAPALRLAPVIGRLRAMLQSADGCLLARLSGSGPTCFGLFGTANAARAAAEMIANGQPDWWVRDTVLS